MNENRNDISTLVSILSIKYPTQYPKKESIDELDSFLPAINFPNYSDSDIDSFSSFFLTKTTFKDIIEHIHFYFPFVPAILEIIANYKQDTTDEILDICACIVMCSYVSWRAFCEYTKNFEHLQYLLNCIPLVSRTKYASIITDIYCDSLNYYLDECASFNFNSIFTSMTLLLEKKSINILSKMQSMFYTIFSEKILTNTNSENANDSQVFINYLCQLTDVYPDIFQSNIAKDFILLLTKQIENIEIYSLHLFANLYHLIEKEVTIPIFTIFPVSYYKHIISMPEPFLFPAEQENKMAIQLPDFDFSFDAKKIMHQKIEDYSNFQLIEATFLNGIPDNPTLSVNRNHPNGILLNKQTREILTYIAQAAQKDEECRDIIIKDFNSFIVQKENKYHNILLYSLIFIVSNLNLNAKQAKAYWDILLSSEIFNDNFSIFNYNESDQIINQIRAEAIDSMILSGYIGIHSFLSNLAKNQLLLAELFHRLYYNVSSISKIEYLSTDFLIFLVHFFLYLQKLNIEEKSNIQIIESTRVCLLHLISQGLSINDVAIFWFSIPFFTNFYSSLILEDPLRNYVLEQYKHYLLNYFHQNDQVFFSGIKRLFNELLSNISPYEKSLSILIDFVKMIDSVLTAKNDSVELFYELIDIIADTLTIIDYRSEESHLYFIQVLQVFSFIKLNQKHFTILEEATKKLYNEKFAQKIKEELYKLASGNNYYYNEIFPLQQAQIISVILKNIDTRNDEILINYFESEVHPLLKNSIYNCSQAFNYGIENFLIKKLKDLQKENPINFIFSSKILNILTSIYSIKGSMESAQQLIEFLCPTDLKHVSSLSPYFLQVLTTLFTNYSKMPNSFLPFSSKLDILNVDSILFHKSFELSFWCLIEPYKLKNSSYQVCSIIDSKGKGIVVSFTDNKIIVNFLKKHEETIELDVTFPKGKWHLIRIMFSFDHPTCGISRQSSQSSIDSSSIRSTSIPGRIRNGSKSFNNSDYSPLSMFNTQPLSRSPIFSQLASASSNQPLSPLKKATLSFNFSPSFGNLSDFNSGFNSGFGGKLKQTSVKFLTTVCAIVDGNESGSKEANLRMFPDQFVTLKIGSTSDNNCCSIPNGYFACFSIFQSNSKTDNFFNWDNKKRQIVASENPLLMVNFRRKEGQLKAVCKPNNGLDISIENSSDFMNLSSMADVFINEMKIHSLIFLFAEFDLLTIDEVKVPAFADFTVEMIGALIQCGKRAQISFYESNCTEAISHLFSLCNSTNLNFSIYLQLVSLLNLIVVPELKEKILSMIVLNFDIWGRAEPEVFRLITQHWGQNLFIDYKSRMKEITSLPFLLYFMKDHCENEKILNNICNLFVKISDIEFTSQDFLNMIECCLINKDKVKVVVSYLDLLKKILLTRKESDNVLSHHIQFVSILHDLLDLNDEMIFRSVIEIVMICHQKNFIKNKMLTLQNHVNMIMNKVTIGICTMNTLKMIVDLSNSTNQSFYPLCCLVALNLGREGIEFLSKTIKPSKLLVASIDRLIWMLILLINIEDIEKQKEFCFLFNSNYSKIKETCILIQIISIACNKMPELQLNSFLCLEFSLISDHPENFQADFVHKILKIAYKSLLFQSTPSVSEWIQKVVENSPFNNNFQSDSFNKNNSKIRTKNTDFNREEIYKKIEEICNSKSKIVFRLCPRLDENGNWLESSLAFQCLKLFEIYFKSSLLTYDLILCAFIFKVNPALARTHLQRINISNYSSKIPANLLSFIFYSGESRGIDLTQILGSKPIYTKFAAFTFLQEFSDQIKTDVFGSEMVKMSSDIASLYDQCCKIERNFVTFSNNTVIDLKEKFFVIFDKIKCKRIDLRFQTLHVWQQMWNEMSRIKGKWSHARNSGAVKSHFKRSSRFIFNDHSNSYYPLKMTLNNEFYNDHVDASIARDAGSISEAKMKINEYRNKKKPYGVVFSTLRPTVSSSFASYYEHVSTSSISYEKYLNSNPAFRKKAILIKPKGCKEGYFEVFFDAFVINQKPILFSEIREILLRRRLHHQTAFEIFKKNGKAYFIEIPNYSNTNLMKYFLPFMSTSTIFDYTEKWVNYEISTFEYLLKLNEFSSRTFNDLSAYPIMPWIISDYQSEKLDLDDPNTFRDLSKPMGAINEDRLKILKSNSVNTGESIPVHLYPNGYLSPLIVLSYLVRIEPFTTLHINYHSGKFEHSTKIFKSIALAYKNATTLNSDFMELIPEFFTTPEFLLNKENLDLTRSESKKLTQNQNKSLDDDYNNNLSLENQENSTIADFTISSDQIPTDYSNLKNATSASTTNDSDKNTTSTTKSRYQGYVQLPKWAMHSSNIFVYMNRKALESNYVSMNIHKWIDLIWGYKQTGPEAEKADNTFYPFMYSDVWARLKRKEFDASPIQVETILSEIGQIPIQLFNNPHPSRQPPSKNSWLTNPIKSEEIITFGNNQIVFSSFSAIKIDENVNSISNIGVNLVNSAKNATKMGQKSQKQRDFAVFGLTVDSNGRLIGLNIRNKAITIVFNDTIEKQTSFIASNEINKLCSFGDVISPTTFVCCSNNYRLFYVFKPIEKVILKSGSVNSTISHIAFDESIVVTSSENIISVWAINDVSKPIFTLPTYRNEISCIGVSSPFDIFVSGTLDGYVIFNSINERRSIQISEIGDIIPLQIKITPAWGFVLVYGKSKTINSDSNFLILFSANGTKIRQVEMPRGEDLTAIDIYKSKDGFDFAFVATETGNLYHFEVFFAKFDKPFYKAPFCINSISYILEQSVLCCTGKDNSILVIPYSVA